jgi:hypothetical protein
VEFGSRPMAGARGGASGAGASSCGRISTVREVAHG